MMFQRKWLQRLLAIPALIGVAFPAGRSGRVEPPTQSRLISAVTHASPKVTTAARNGHSVLPANLRPKFDEETTDRLATQICDVSDGDQALNPKNVKVYREFQRSICKEAIRFGITPQLLAITLQHEGNGRMAFVHSHPNAREIEELANGTHGISGKGESVGIGQMHPDQAVGLAQRYDNEQISYDEARLRLIYDDNYAIHIAAAYLRRLQEDQGFNDKQTFIAYAFPEAKYDELRLREFEGKESTARGHRFNELYAEIVQCRGYEERVTTLELLSI